MPPFGHKAASLQIATSPDVTRESAVKALSSYNKERVLGILSQIRAAGPGCAESLNLAQQVARLLHHHDAEVATAALSCLGLMGHKAGAYEQEIVDCLGHSVGSVRAAAVEALGHLGPYIKNPQVVADHANDEDATVRVKVCQAIAETEATMLHETLNSLLEDASLEVQSAALEALGLLISMSQEVQSVYDSKITGYVSTMLVKSGTKISALDAIVNMGNTAPSSCVSAVVNALGDKDIFTRQAAVAAFGVLSDSVGSSKEGLSKVQEFLKSQDVGVRAAAACALAAMGEKAAGCAKAVAELLTDDKEDTSGAAYVMGNGARRPPPQMRRPKCAAVMALGGMGVKDYIGKISEALNDHNWEVRLSAASALAGLGQQAKKEVSALLGSMEDDAFPVRAMCCYALGQIKDTEALPRLLEALEDSAYTVRLYAVQAVAEMGQVAEEHSHDVFKLTDDSTSSVRAAAVKALAKLGTTGQNYASVVATMLSDQDPEIRMAACEALSGMGELGRACSEEVQELLNDPLPAVRQGAIVALESMGLYQSPFLKDFGRGPGVPNDPKLVLMPGEVSFEGLGSLYGDILQKKRELVGAGKWIEGVL